MDVIINILNISGNLLINAKLQDVPKDILKICIILMVAILNGVAYCYLNRRFPFNPPIGVVIPQKHIDNDKDNEILFIRDRKKCVVCLEKRPRYMFACGHLNVCKKCFEKLENQTICPECRQECSIVYFKGKKTTNKIRV